MSRTYQCQLSESITDTVRASDESVWELQLSPILDPDLMVELLRQALERRGFVEREDGRLGKAGADGEMILVDTELMEVVVQRSDERTLTTQVAGEGYGESRAEAHAAAEHSLAREGQAARADHERTEQVLQEELTETLVTGEKTRRRELNEAVQEAYAEALKRKARELGDVIEIQEGTSESGDYELVIKVSQ